MPPLSAILYIHLTDDIVDVVFRRGKSIIVKEQE